MVIHNFTIIIFTRKKKKFTSILSLQNMDGGGVSAAAIEILLQSLINVFKEEHSLLRGLDEDAQQLQTTLGIIQGYLNDAEKKSITQDAVKIWLRKLEALAFDADNVVDELSYHLLHKEVNKMKTRKDKVLSCFSSFNHISRPRNMALRIKQINTSFENMNKRATELGLQSIVVNAPAAAALNASFETDSFSLDPIFIGRDDDVPKLVEMLTHTRSEERIFSIIALVGMGGMGKTTLTRKVFNHEKMKTRFGSRLWVHVSQTFDPILLFKKILFKMAKNTADGDGVESRDDDILETRKTIDGVESREDILEKLQVTLKTKTYLLVLDDIWNEDVPTWEGFINSISGVTSTKGNGIIITTRNEKVASIVNPLDIHMLKGLSDEDCWSIIKAKTFVENGDQVPSGLEMIGKKIAERCKGLPLAANVVGGVLRRKSQKEWLDVEQRWLTDVDGDNISKILRLSFDNLSSPSLKKCFTYCSIFPKGDRIVKQKLIEQWMAEGFLQPNRRDDMESVGEMFFNMLLQNSLLQVAGRDDIGNVESCVMHDLVHDLASSVLGSSSNADGCNQIRYITLQGSKPVPKQVAKHLRTLFLEGDEIPGNLESLHVLTLKRYGVQELPNSVRKMIHLRNLDISNTGIKNLPDWISEFHHLQTLRAERWDWEVSKLVLPSTLKYLINLRHLYIDDDVKLPAEIGRLSCLQTLRHFKVGDNKGYQIEELGSLKNLKGQLVISSLEKVQGKEEAEKAKIFEKLNLFDLGFEWDEDREGERNVDESVLEGLQPHANANLKKLGIYGFKGKRFPEWIEKMAVRDGPQASWVPLENLIQITLERCSECEEIPQLEHLPNLKSLSLIGLEKVRFINSSFNNLSSLKIGDLEGLECLPDWLFYKNQNLSELEIWKCPRLRELPDGLDTLNSLEKLTIYECRNVKSIGNPSGREGQSQGILRQLTIEGCEGLMVLPRQMLESWAPTIERLRLRGLSSLKNLPMVIDCLAKAVSLGDLTIVDVPKLFMSTDSVKSLGLGCLQSLVIDVSWEWSMESSVGIKQTVDALLQGCCNSLTSLVLRGVENWEWLPESIQHLTALDCLVLDNLGVEELPEWLGNLPSLRWLYLNSCNKLRRLPSCWGDALKFLIIKDCGELGIDPIPAEWHNNFPNLTVWVDGREIKPCSKTSTILSRCFRKRN
ncbi:putative disease resistance protein RGA1 [Salvia miltiorrhiza]|uniref:putative disease resistance protein RGA1 n=1 Tax=Salvia miltiorrhiza TaxID=226208 RepID=UPI0025AC6A40|nr:putative disease resistance protein RGA1 [Salvia miltiorrhiza]